MVMKKKGSTLITVVAVFAILFTIGTAILSLSLSSYKLRRVESKKIENLYGSESGIDSSKKIIEVAIQTAIKKANLDVVKANNDINSQIEALKVAATGNYHTYIDQNIVSNNRSSNGFNYLVWLRNDRGDNNPANTLYYLDNNGQINLDSVRAKLDAVFHKSYMEFLRNNLSLCFVTNEDGSHSYKYLLLDASNNVALSDFNLSNNSVINITYTHLTDDQIADNSESSNSFPVTLSSTFTSNDGVRRQIEATYTISMPNLTKNIVINNPLLQKSIAADGNMYIKGNLTVNGDVFVKGQPQQNNNSEIVYTKYDGGINVNIDPSERSGGAETLMNSIAVSFNGNVVTPNTVNIKQNSNVTVDGGNLYANNVNIGKINANDANIRNNILNVNTDMLVYNDFTFNADSSTVNINNLYAINDLRVDSNDNTMPERTSSSLIVNRALTNGSSISINNDAYILGSAYIRVGDEANSRYQTGESVAVKGNYLAYTSPINDGHTYQFGYFSPLQLVSKIQGQNGTFGDMSFDDKTNYFLSATRSGDATNPNIEDRQSARSIHLGTDLDKLLISGAYISNGQVHDPVPDSVAKIQKLHNKQKEYANQAYEMGDFKNPDYTTTNANIGHDPLLDKYFAMNVDKTVSNLINLTSFGNREPIQIDDDNTIVAVYNTESNLPILLSDNETANPRYSKVLNINNKKGIIITNRNVVFDSKNINFSGTIISTKDVTFLNGTSANVNINYDGQAVKKLVNQYNLQLIFNTSSSNDSIITSILQDSGDIDYRTAIGNNSWRITK